jgi:YD repeat-containing protein
LPRFDSRAQTSVAGPYLRNRGPITNSISWTYDGAGRVLSRTANAVTPTYGYDANGNRLSATTGSLAITATYDRLNRPLTVDDEDAGTTADTTYAYSLTSPSWTDPTGTYLVSLDPGDIRRRSGDRGDDDDLPGPLLPPWDRSRSGTHTRSRRLVPGATSTA